MAGWRHPGRGSSGLGSQGSYFSSLPAPKAERSGVFPALCEAPPASLCLWEELEATQGELLSALPFAWEYPRVPFYQLALTLHLQLWKGNDYSLLKQCPPLPSNP